MFCQYNHSPTKQKTIYRSDKRLKLQKDEFLPLYNQHTSVLIFPKDEVNDVLSEVNVINNRITVQNLGKYNVTLDTLVEFPPEYGSINNTKKLSKYIYGKYGNDGNNNGYSNNKKSDIDILTAYEIFNICHGSNKTKDTEIIIIKLRSTKDFYL